MIVAWRIGGSAYLKVQCELLQLLLQIIIKSSVRQLLDISRIDLQREEIGELLHDKPQLTHFVFGDLNFGEFVFGKDVSGITLQDGAPEGVLLGLFSRHELFQLVQFAH